MRVQALASFAGLVGGQMTCYTRGQEFDLPAGVDWLQAGLVAPAPHLVGIEHAVDAGAMTAERRDGATNWGDALITDIDGIGPVTAGLLAEAGIETLAELLAVDAPTLAMLARVNVRKAQAWQQRAQALVQGEGVMG